jgi:hypothetical protein
LATIEPGCRLSDDELEVENVNVPVLYLRNDALYRCPKETHRAIRGRGGQGKGARVHCSEDVSRIRLSLIFWLWGRASQSARVTSVLLDR